MSLATVAALAAGAALGSGCAADDGDDTAVPTAPTPSAKVETVEQCEAAGGRFVPSIGDEPRCADGETSLGAIRHGIEGGLCCK